MHSGALKREMKDEAEENDDEDEEREGEKDHIILLFSVFCHLEGLEQKLKEKNTSHVYYFTLSREIF